MTFAVTLPFLSELVALFTVSVFIAYVCYRFKIVPIAGFLIAGVIIGPNALGLVQDQELVNILAEIGIILLLFTIGIEFSLEKLSRIKKAIFLGGGLQVGITVALAAFILSLWGVNWNSAIYTGCLVALSSTAIILGIYSDEDKTDTPSGQLSLAVLIFQDLIIILMVLLVPVLAGQSQSMSEIGWVLLKAAVLIVVVLFLAQRLVPWILEQVAKTRREELFLLTIVAICFGTAALTNLAGVSLALGAFLAGLVVSESHYSEQAISEILPLRTIFNAVFFVSVGMLLDLRYVIDYPLVIVGIALGVVVLKFILNTLSLMTLRYPLRIISASGFTLAQIGEFSFVLERAGRAAGLSPAGAGEPGTQTFIAVAVILMVCTPFMVHQSTRLGDLLSETPLRHLSPAPMKQDEQHGTTLEDHVIIVGYGPAGQHLAQVLRDTGIPFVVIEMNPHSIKEMHKQDIHAIFGDASRRHILNLAAIKRAKMCVIATNDPGSSPLIVQQARQLNPTLQIVVRTRYLSEIERFVRLGADTVVPEEIETTVRLFSQVLSAYRIPQEEISKHLRELRAHDYGIVRDSMRQAQTIEIRGLDDESLHSRVVTIREDAPVANRTLQDLQLRNRHHLTVLAVKRNEQTIGNPSGDFMLQPGDQLIMMGNAEQFASCADLFRQPTS